MIFVPLRTSQSSPLQIPELHCTPGNGRLGLTLCPGKKDPAGRWDRDLHADILAIRNWGASTVITLIEAHEFQLLGIEDLHTQVVSRGMHWVHLPIRDVDVPDERFGAVWPIASGDIHRRLDAGERLLIHCRGGLGRTGRLAALILTERGCDPRDAINRVRAARPNAIETAAQEAFVLRSKANG